MRVQPLSTKPALHFQDAQEQSSALSGLNQEYLQLSAGMFQGELNQVEGSGIKLFVERVEQSVFQTGLLPQGVLALGVPLDASGGGMFCGRACDLNSLHLFSGSSGFEFRTSRQHTMLGIELQLPDTVDIAPHADAYTQAARPTRAVRSYVMDLYQSARRTPELLSNPAIVASVGDFLLDNLAQASHTTGHAVGAADAHWALVQQCVAMVTAEWESAPTVTQMCVAISRASTSI